MIEFENVSFAYEGGCEALKEVNLHIEAGEFVLLCGPSGGGKSTLLMALNGLVPHFFQGQFSGQVLVDGLDTREHPVYELFTRVGLVFQNPDAQVFAGTVERELAFGLESLGVERREMQERITWAAQVTGITHILNRPPHFLSGGEKQLVVIAAMLALKPRVLALDEPFAHLDPAAVLRVVRALREINRLGVTVLVAEHRLHYVIPYASRIVVMKDGRVVMDGPPRQVLREHLEEMGLNIPAPVRLFRDLGLPEVPLSVEEAISLLEKHRPPHPSLPSSFPPYLLRKGKRSKDREDTPPAFPFVIKCQGVSFSFNGHEALRDVSLSVERGSILAIVGANGAGKTTLVKHFNGLYKPHKGKVEVLGMDTRKVRVADLAAQVGLVFQNPYEQLFASSVREELEIGPRILGKRDERWLAELIELFDLKGLLERPPLLLSEGEKKRVAFASVIATRPEIIVLDEPTAGQDEVSRRRLGKLLSQLRSRGHTVVLVTHDLEFAEENAGTWVVLGQGKVLAQGTPHDIMADEALMKAAALVPTDSFVLHRFWAAAQPSPGSDANLLLE